MLVNSPYGSSGFNVKGEIYMGECSFMENAFQVPTGGFATYILFICLVIPKYSNQVFRISALKFIPTLTSSSFWVMPFNF
jgi:hypothetical protein